MKLKLIDLLNSVEILEKLKNEKFEDGVTTFKIARNIKRVNEELSLFYQAKESILTEFGIKNNEKIPVEKRDEFTKAINNILAQTIDIDILQINPSKISGYSPMEILFIDWMLDLNS